MAAATAAAAGPVVATRVPPTAAGEPFVVGEGVSTAVATAVALDPGHRVPAGGGGGDLPQAGEALLGKRQERPLTR